MMINMKLSTTRSTSFCWMLLMFALTIVSSLSPSCCLAAEEEHEHDNSNSDECIITSAADNSAAVPQETTTTCSSSSIGSNSDDAKNDNDSNNPPPRKNNNKVKNHRPSQRNTLECGIYMAPSTLGEETNMGIYTGHDMQVNDVVNYPEIAIPLLFREWGEHPDGYIDGSLWERYIWEGSVMDIESYSDTDREMSRAVFVPGVGCTINAVMDIANIESTHGSKYDTAGLHRKKDPGVGSFTPYHSSETTITHAVQAGAELFASYGAEWIPAIPGAQVTLNPDLDKANSFLQDVYWPFVQHHATKMTESLKHALWEFTSSADFPITSPPMTNLPRAQPWSVVEQAILKHEQKQQQRNMSTTDDDNANDEQSISQEKDEKEEEEEDVVRQFIRQQSIRTMDWLNENGYCQDHIIPGRSTILQAGRGAFAARDLPRGTIVGYSPLIHMGTDGREILDILYEDNLVVASNNDDDDEPPPPPTEMDRHLYDLILNYSFGHANSSILLTPYGGMVNYINHDSKNPNVRIKWPDYELVAHKPDWLEKDIKFIRDTINKIGLSFEYVATRDIKTGEELFMDYGKEWEDAWNEHVARWEPLDDAHEYVHSSQWKEAYFRTYEELTELGQPYPSNLHTMCIESFSTDDDGNFYFIPILRETTERVYCDVVNRRKQKKQKTNDDVVVVDDDVDDEYEYIYDVDLKLMADDDESWVHVRNYRTEGIFLYDRAFATDWHMPNVFRHEIMIPDEIMPKSWQNGPPVHPFR